MSVKEIVLSVIYKAVEFNPLILLKGTHSCKQVLSLNEELIHHKIPFIFSFAP